MKAALIRLHLAIFLWGFTGVLGRLISLNEGWLVWWRLLITVVSLWIYFWWRGEIKRVDVRGFLKIGAIGTILALHWLCFYGSIKYSNVSIALTCLSTSGLLSAIIEPLFFRKRINPGELALGLFALAGIGIIYFSNLHFSAGIYIGLLAAVLTVTVSVLNKKVVTGYEPAAITLYQLTGGFIGLSVLMPVYHLLFPTDAVVPVKWDWLWLLVLSWVCTIFTFFLYIAALKKVSAFTMNLTLTLEPVYGVLLAFMLFQENKTLSMNFYIGFLLILLAVILQMLRIIRLAKKNRAMQAQA
ncbi:drug/metabolite transporter (DMT)-like permease [Filimonas zeae]|uniref:Permease n=1 Tax=Filimonas zeae TaxID=1737353 RepID=A0A917INB1_9BACT|nr:EamA family transporter [Filimonas zeae]MDR6337281.1 drug/metabolite transporter (DMT)-like permease [Filimonas zeae]GGH57845.1 permease [Filimonas zeae]